MMPKARNSSNAAQWVSMLLAVVVGSLSLGLALALGPRPAARAQDEPKSHCVAETNKVAVPAAPTAIDLGQTVDVTLTVTSSCPKEVSPVDVMLVMDISASMLDNNKMVNAKKASKTFIKAMDLAQSRVGLVAFNQDAGVHSKLTQDAAAVNTRIDALIPTGLTNISGAIDLATQTMVEDQRDVQQAMIVLTDGVNTVPTDPVPVAAGRAKDRGILVVTICAGGECDPGLPAAASAPEFYFNVPDASELEALYTTLAGALQANAIVRWTVLDRVPANMTYIAGSARPPVFSATTEPSGETLLEWRLVGPFPAEGLTYTLQPEEVGLHPTNVEALADFVDRKGLPGSVPFRIPQVLVRGKCPPIPLEVYFLIDDSNCLAGATLNGMDARSAIRKGVEEAMIQFGMGAGSPHTAAVIGYGDTAEIFQTLTGSPDEVLAGVDRITMRDSAANLDLAYREVARELRSVRHRAGTNALTINITDGPMMQAPEAARAVADALRRGGARHYNIAVGTIAQFALLRQISEPGGFWTLPFGGDAIGAYREFGGIAGAIARPEVCPPPSPTPAPGDPTFTATPVSPTAVTTPMEVVGTLHLPFLESIR